MQVYRYILRLTMFSVNEYRNTHHFALNRIKRQYSEDIAWQLKTQKPKTMQGPVAIQFIYHWHQSRYDLDNQIIAKFVIDVLKKSHRSNEYGLGIIEDDSIAHVRKISHMVGDKKDNTVELLIHELVT